MSVRMSKDMRGKETPTYLSPTEKEAIENIRKQELVESDHYYNLLDHIEYICDLAGFEIIDGIKLKDLKTGKVWR